MRLRVPPGPQLVHAQHGHVRPRHEPPGGSRWAAHRMFFRKSQPASTHMAVNRSGLKPRNDSTRSAPPPPLPLLRRRFLLLAVTSAPS